jgi:hypothetical protein
LSGGVGLTEQQVRLEFQKEEEEDARKGIAGKHKVSPEAFMRECVDVEEEQYVPIIRWEENVG